MSQFIEMFGTVENNTHNFPIMTIGEFANCFAGATPSTSHPEYWENGRIRWMSSGEVHKGHVEDTDFRITELGYKSASTRMVPIHSIVIAIAGQGKTRGTVAITEVDLCTNQSLCAIVPDERVNYLYLYHNLQGRYLELRGLSGDVNGRGGLNLKIIQKIPVILPPIEKQQQFASIAQQADKSKFGDFKSQFIEMYYNTHNKQTLESVCPIMSKGITPKYVESSSVLVINQACIHWDGQRLGNIKYHNEEIPVRKRILESGDVLLNATGNGTLGRCCVFICPSDNNTYINDGHVIALSTDRAVILPEVLNTYLSLNDTQAEIYRQYVTGSTNQVDIVFSDIKKMKVPVPSMDEQILFVEVLKQADKSKFGDFKSQFIEMFGDTHMRSDHSRQWKEVVEIINGKDYKSIQVEDGGYPVYGTGGEMARASDYLSPANSILLGRKGTIDKPLLIREKYWNVDTAFGAVPDEKVLHYVYFYWHCKTIDFNVLNKGTTLPSTTKVDLLNLWIKIPSMEEQTRFGSIVEQADKSKSVIQKALVYLNDIQSDELGKIA